MHRRKFDDTHFALSHVVPPKIQEPTQGAKSTFTPVPIGLTLPLPFDITETAEVGQEINVVATYNLRIDCVITRGIPAPILTWLHNSIPLSNESHEVLSNGSLLIRSVTPGRDNGTFTCMADSTNVGHDELSSTVTVIGK